ncbi:MAG: PRC-barrel domain-containing protein [Longimicrobiales bacterium]
MARDNTNRRDGAGIGPDPDFSRRLYPIDELKDYRIASGEPDVRGWSVCTLNGREVGEVEDLLVDPARGEVVMLEVDLDRSGRHVSVPLRSVQVDRSRNCVVVDSADVDPERGVVHDARLRDRLTDEDRSMMDQDVRDARIRDVRYDASDRGTARTVDATDDLGERKPVVEEVVVKRRVVDPDALDRE